MAEQQVLNQFDLKAVGSFEQFFRETEFIGIFGGVTEISFGIKEKTVGADFLPDIRNILLIINGLHFRLRRIRIVREAISLFVVNHAMNPL